MPSTCPICNYEAEFLRADTGRKKITCPKCGTFALSEEAVDDLPALLKSDEYKRALLSHKVCRSQDNNHLPVWEYELCDNVIKNHSLPDVYEQIDGVLEWVGKNSQNPGNLVNLPSAPIVAFVGALNHEAVFFALQSLAELNLIEFKAVMGGGVQFGHAKLTIHGWQRYDEITKGGVGYNKVFMAMKFGDENLKHTFENYFRPAVEKTGYRLFKLDDQPEAGLIDIRMRQEIKTSKFVIADLSHDNLGAYWEAGFAEGIGKSVIYTCERGKFETAKTHFDVNHHLTIIWDIEDPSVAANDLKAAIRYTFPESKQQD